MPTVGGPRQIKNPNVSRSRARGCFPFTPHDGHWQLAKGNSGLGDNRHGQGGKLPETKNYFWRFKSSVPTTNALNRIRHPDGKKDTLANFVIRLLGNDYPKIITENHGTIHKPLEKYACSHNRQKCQKNNFTNVTLNTC
jgi:hypothetical protein